MEALAVIPEPFRFGLRDLQILQALHETLEAAPFTLAELVDVAQRFPRTIARLAHHPKGA